jgi:hypothetical protein
MSASIAYLGPQERALSDFLRRWIENGRLVISKRRTVDKGETPWPLKWAEMELQWETLKWKVAQWWGKEAEQEEAGVYSENAEVESKTIQWRKK